MRVGSAVKYNGKTYKVTKITPGGGLVTIVGPKGAGAPSTKVVPLRNVEKG